MSEVIAISPQQLNKLIRGSKVTINGSNVESDHQIELMFSDTAALKRFMKNTRLGKGTRVALSDFHKLEHDGGDLNRDIRRGFNKVGKAIKNSKFARDIGRAGIGKIAETVGEYYGGPIGGILGAVGGDHLSNKIGLGIKKDLKKFGRQAKKGLQKFGKDLGRELKPIARELYNDTKQHAIQKMKQGISEQINTNYLPRAGEFLDKHTGDTYYGDRLYEATHRAMQNQGMNNFTDYGDGYGDYGGSGLRTVARVNRQVLTTRGRPKKVTPQMQAVNEAMSNSQQYESVGGVVDMTDTQKMMKGAGLRSDVTRAYKKSAKFVGGSLTSDIKKGYKKSTNYIGGSLTSDIKRGYNTSKRYVGGSMMPLR